MHRGFRRTVATVALLTLLLFVGYEIGVRLVTPDEVRYEVRSGGPLTPTVTSSGTITDAATITQLRAALAASHPTRSLKDAYLTKLTGEGCSFGGWTTVTLWFTWHNLPVETVSPGPGCAFVWSQVSVGGIPNPRLYLIDPNAWRLP